MAMEGTLLVTPSALITTSGEFQNCMNQVQTLTGNMMELVNGTASYWKGDAADAYRNKFHQLQDDIEKIHKMIQEHVDDLMDMARVYQDAENKSQQISASLSGSVL
ncbi:WXG100 family type VII secretion target [Brotaphodocola sp.]|uniref:WXG100 family type VII secretion target n=1 Tax=Brotaphodocola sp. TaxID=3073577 RepID=UPI003D7D9B50